MNLNRIFKRKMQLDYQWDTFYNMKGAKKKDKILGRRRARHRMKQDKFYNGFYEFIEENRKRSEKNGNNY